MAKRPRQNLIKSNGNSFALRSLSIDQFFDRKLLEAKEQLLNASHRKKAIGHSTDEGGIWGFDLGAGE